MATSGIQAETGDTIKTASNLATNVLPFDIPNNSAVQVEYWIEAKDTQTPGLVGISKRRAGCKRVDGGSAILLSEIGEYTDSEITGLKTQIKVSGNTVFLEIIGPLNQTTDWFVFRRTSTLTVAS